MIGNAQRAAGGLNQVTIPLQGQSMVQGQFTGYGGGFNSPVITPGIQNGQWNLAYWVVPIPLPFGESILQATDREISLLKARMNDAYATTKQNMSKLFFTNNSGNTLFPDSYQSAFDNGTNFPTYGGISRLAAGNQAFQGQYINAGTGTTWNTQFTTATVGWTRSSMATLLNYITDNAGGEAPSFVVMAPGDFATLNNSFVGIETAFVDPGKSYTMDTPIRSSFPNLNVSGIPIFQDHFCPKGNLFAVNTKYTSMYMSEDASFDFCVPADTRVTLADGTTKAMRDMRPGDCVATVNGGRQSSRVLEFMPKVEDDIFEVRANGRTVRANARHPFLIKQANGVEKYIRLQHLKVGDAVFLLDDDGDFHNYPIESIVPSGHEMVFDIHVERDHNFVANDFVVHNSGFYSLVPLGQIGQQGVVVLGYDVISAKSVSGAWVFGFGGSAF
jgi:hypothetical protein